MKQHVLTIGFLLCVIAASPVSAQTMPAASPAPKAAPSGAPVASPAPAPSPSPSAVPSPSPSPKLLQFSGFADAGYTSRVGDTTTRFTSNAPSRVFDYIDREPVLNNLNVQAVLTSGSLGGKLELSAGSDADIIASYPGAFNGFDVTQAYLTYTSGKLALQGGKFETLAGAEVIESPSNTQYSRSILFGFAVPFTHTGGRLTFAATPHLSVIAGLNAGWDEIRSTNGRLTAEYGLAFNPSSAVSLTAQGYTGYEQLSNYANGFNPYVPGTGNGLPSAAQGQRTLIDAVATVHATSALTFNANYDRGRQGNAGAFTPDGATTAGWSGLAGYATYQGAKLSGSLRYEGFHDSDGYRTGFQQFWREGTATLGYNLTSSVTLRGEYRHDTSDGPVFLRSGGGASNSTGTFALEAFYKF